MIHTVESLRTDEKYFVVVTKAESGSRWQWTVPAYAEPYFKVGQFVSTYFMQVMLEEEVMDREW